MHRSGHGLVADEIHEVTPGILPAPASGKRMFMDTHRIGPGVKAADVADAHKKDLAVQGRRRALPRVLGGRAERRRALPGRGPDAQSVTETHREAHGLLPDAVLEVKSPATYVPAGPPIHPVSSRISRSFQASGPGDPGWSCIPEARGAE